MKRFVYLILAGMYMGHLQAYAQTDTCITRLKDAGSSYDQENYDDAISLLKSTINNCQLDKPDNILAHKLLIMCYIAVDNLEAADNTAGQIMKINPDYIPDKFKDDPKLTALFKKFRSTPVLTIGIDGGVNIPFEHTVNQYSVVYPNGQAPASYKTKPGFQVGLQAERRVFNNIWAELGCSYRVSSYKHALYDVDSLTINYSEKLTYFDVPLSVKYYFPMRRVRPYLQAGLYFSFLTNALSTTTSGDLKDIIDRMALRNTYQTGYFGGAGIGYAIKNFMLFINVRYIVFPENVNRAGTRYEDHVNLFKYYYIDDDFRLNNMQVGGGASINLQYKNVRVKG